MKDKIINLKDGTSIYIADEMDYQGRRYVMAYNMTK